MPAAKLTVDSLPLEAGQTSIVQHFRPAEGMGLSASTDTAAVYTGLNGLA